MVTDENGMINQGDYLTSSSTPGTAMKATKWGRVIGIALEPFDSNQGKIMMFVNPHENLAPKVNELSEENREQQQQIDELKRELEALKNK